MERRKGENRRRKMQEERKITKVGTRQKTSVKSVQS